MRSEAPTILGFATRFGNVTYPAAVFKLSSRNASTTETAQISPTQESYILRAGAISANGLSVLGTIEQPGSCPAYIFERPKTGWVTTSTPNIEWNVNYVGPAVQIGAPGIAAMSSGTNGSASVLLFAQ